MLLVDLACHSHFDVFLQSIDKTEGKGDLPPNSFLQKPEDAQVGQELKTDHCEM